MTPPAQPAVLELVARPVAPADRVAREGRVLRYDAYDLARPAADGGVDIDAFAGLIITMHCDQVFLHSLRERLTSWVRAGGRLLVGGHPLLRFVDGLPEWRKLDFHGLDDIWLSEGAEHPIWAGVDRRDLLLRTGVPGRHTFDELTRIGVGGFYSHCYVSDLPDRGEVHTGIGPYRLPVDVSYPLGTGEVVLHAGNDLLGFADPNTSAAALTANVLDYLEGR